MSKPITPIDVVRKNNPLIKGITEVSEKWRKRWPDIDQPWRAEGTLNPNVIKTIRILVTMYGAGQRKGKKGTIALFQKRDSSVQEKLDEV